jgi:hypothetical protein
MGGYCVGEKGGAHLAMLALLFLLAPDPAPDAAIVRAVAYLSREVPRWHRENQCYSCHDNGDAARALYAASRKGYRVPPAALADTAKWLGHPETWDSNRGNPASNPEISDKKLARIQFAGALDEACMPGPLRIRPNCSAWLTAATGALKQDQKPDGSWHVDAGGAVGSPVTYGPYLATYMALQPFHHFYPDSWIDARERANAWFAASKPSATIDRAALIMAMPSRTAEQLPPLLDAQNPDGGWGPYRHTRSEPFDTAVVLLALQGKDAREAVSRGRAWLLKNQSPEGDWPETTRPADLQSYAQHISTAGWATLALLATSP